MKLWGLSLALLAISVFDLVSTSIGIHFGYIEEMNPIALKMLEMGGIPLFAAGKLSITIFGISIIEFLWRKKKISEKAAKFVYLVTILLYVVLYITITLIVNFT